MKVIGVTGGIGSGKSFFCRQLEALNYPCYYADDRAKALMVEDQALRSGIQSAFGEEAYHADGALNRAYLGQQIFQNPSLRETLNALVHPAVFRDTEHWVNAQRVDGHALAFREAAILFESGSAASCDAVVTVYAPLSLRMERVVARDGRPAADVRKRMAAQWPEQRKMLAANYVIFNDGQHLLLPQVASCLAWAKTL